MNFYQLFVDQSDLKCVGRKFSEAIIVETSMIIHVVVYRDKLIGQCFQNI